MNPDKAKALSEILAELLENENLSEIVIKLKPAKKSQQGGDERAAESKTKNQG
jgi:hypothetical protein